MRATVWALVQLTALPSYHGLLAQCPNGAPPPCAARPHAAALPVDSDVVAILPFRVSGPHGDADWLREGIVDLLNTSLDGVAGWRAVQSRTLFARATQGADLTKAADAGRIARSAGAATMVLGSVVAIGPQLRFHAELYDTGRERLIGSVDAQGPAADPGPVVDSLAVGLARMRLGVRPVAAGRAVQEYATSSPLALRAYVAAERLARQGAWQTASDSLLVALVHDSTFGLAYYRLEKVVAFGASPAGWSSRLQILRTALRYSARMPQRQQDLLQTSYAEQAGFRTQALDQADLLGRRYPDDAEAAFEQGESYFHIGMPSGESPQRALAAFDRAVRLDPGWLDPYNHLIELLCLTGDTVRAWSSLEQALAMDPNFLVGRGLEVVMRAGLRGEDPARLVRTLEPSGRQTNESFIGRAVTEALRILHNDPSHAIAVADSLAALAVTSGESRPDRIRLLIVRSLFQLAQGQYRTAERFLQDANALAGPGDAGVAQSQGLLALVAGRGQETLRAARILIALDSTAIPALGFWATAAAIGGDSNSLDSALAALRAHADPSPRYAQALVDGALGLAALQRRDSLAALSMLDRANGFRGYSGPFLPAYFALRLARLERARGEPGSAIRRLADISPQDQSVVFVAEAAELRAEIAVEQGDSATAIRSYTVFMNLWKDADPELQPRVAAARAALARLRH